MSVYKSGHYRVSEVHELYYELWGNPNGIPFVFVHGGPGAGFGEKDYDFFDAAKHRVLFYEQRGSGRSTPYCDLRENETSFLVEDQKELMNEFGFEKSIVFGGSWGSTLGLCFAIKYPEMVNGLILRGIFLAEGWDRAYYTGGGTELFFPEAYRRFASMVPEGKDVLDYYLAQLKSEDGAIRQKFAYEMVRYELSLMDKGWSEEELNEVIADCPAESFALMECNYLANDCFLENGYIVKNANKLKDIPMIIVHGRRDVICPPLHAWKLHEVNPHSELFFVPAGHSSSDSAVKERLVWAVGEMGG